MSEATGNQTGVAASPQGDVPVFEARPAGPARAGVLVIQEAFGVTDHIATVARRLADAGYHALAPHLFHRVGSPVVDYSDFAAAKPLIGQLTGEGILNDADAALGLLERAGLPARRVAVVGFCMGGSAAFFLAARRDLGAAVTYYGGGVLTGRWPGVPALTELAPELRAPWLGHYGDQDASIPVEQVERLRNALAAAPVPTRLVRHADAGHGFNCDDRPAAFHPASAAEAWQTTLDWLDQRLPAG